MKLSRFAQLISVFVLLNNHISLASDSSDDSSCDYDAIYVDCESSFGTKERVLTANGTYIELQDMEQILNEVQLCEFEGLKLENKFISFQAIDFLASSISTSSLISLSLAGSEYSIPAAEKLIHAVQDSKLMILDMSTPPFSYDDAERAHSGTFSPVAIVAWTNIHSLTLRNRMFHIRQLDQLFFNLAYSVVDELDLSFTKIYISERITWLVPKFIQSLGVYMGKSGFKVLKLRDSFLKYLLSIIHTTQAINHILHFNSVEHLDLCGNLITTNTLRLIANHIWINPLIRLELCQNRLSSGSYFYIGQIVSNTQVEYLDLSGNDLGADKISHFASTIRKHNSLRHLDISFNKIGDIGAIDLVSFLRFTEIESLIIDCIDMTSNGIFQISKMLPTSLKVLSLSGNTISFKAAAQLALQLSGSMLEELNMKRMKYTSGFCTFLWLKCMTESIFEPIFKVLPLTRIKILQLSDSKLKSISTIADGFKTSSLEILDISQNPLDISELQKLLNRIDSSNLKRFSCADVDLSGIALKFIAVTRLLYLDLSGTLNEVSAQNLIVALPHMSKLQHLNLKHTKLSMNTRQQLVQAAPNVNILF